MNAARDQFGTAIIVGCFFHWKQAIRKHMVKLEIDKEQVKCAMKKGVLDVLTVIPKSEIKSKGIPYVKSLIDELNLTKSDKQKWAKFWKYFLKFWMSDENFISIWNINSNNSNEKEMHSRVNNGLER